MEILAKERPQKGHVTVGLSTDQISAKIIKVVFK